MHVIAGINFMAIGAIAMVELTTLTLKGLMKLRIQGMDLCVLWGKLMSSSIALVVEGELN